MAYYPISALFNLLVFSIMAFIVFFKSSKIKIRNDFIFLVTSGIVWSGFYFLWQIETSETRALLWSRLLLLGANWAVVAYFKIVITFLNIHEKQKKVLLFSYALASIFTVLLVTPLMVKNVEPTMGFLFWPKAGEVYIFYLLFFGGLSLYSMYLSFNAFKKASGLMKIKIKLVLLGFAVSFLTGSTNYFLWYDIPIKPYLNIFTSTGFIAVFYAIVKYRFMDTKMVLRQSFVYITSIVAVLILAITALYVAEKIYFTTSFIVHAIIITITVTSFPWIKKYFDNLANKYFFTSIHDSGEIVKSLKEKLKSTLNLNQIYDSILNTLRDAFHPTGAAILIYSKEKVNYEIKFNKNWKTEQSKINQYQTLFGSLKTLKETIITEELKNKMVTTEYNEKIAKAMTELNIEILAPLTSREGAFGFIVLGEKETKDIYTENDIQAINNIYSDASFAISNALLYKKAISVSKNY